MDNEEGQVGTTVVTIPLAKDGVVEKDAVQVTAIFYSLPQKRAMFSLKFCLFFLFGGYAGFLQIIISYFKTKFIKCYPPLFVL